MNVVLITVLSSMTTKHLHSYSPWLKKPVHSTAWMLAVLCVEHHFQILYACAHVVLFQEQRPVIGVEVRLVHTQNIKLALKLR